MRAPRPRVFQLFIVSSDMLDMLCTGHNPAKEVEYQSPAILRVSILIPAEAFEGIISKNLYINTTSDLSSDYSGYWKDHNALLERLRVSTNPSLKPRRLRLQSHPESHGYLPHLRRHKRRDYTPCAAPILGLASGVQKNQGCV
jgi:hypothetical protein